VINNHDPAVVEVKDLSHTYPSGVEALKGVSLCVQQGDVFGIIGQNGCGKTTLVKHFNGLLRPTGGEVRVFGNNSKEKTIAELSADVGFVFQNPDFQLFLTSVEQEINFGPNNIRMPEEERRQIIEQLVSRLGLSERMQSHPFELTRLERKMVSIASVLAMKPRVVVFDEPTTGQDAVQTRAIMELFRDFSRDGHTLIIVSHDMSLIAEYCNRVSVMKGGSVLACDTPRTVFADRSTLTLAGLEPPEITQIAQQARLDQIFLSVSEAFEWIIGEQRSCGPATSGASAADFS